MNAKLEEIQREVLRLCARGELGRRYEARFAELIQQAYDAGKQDAQK